MQAIILIDAQGEKLNNVNKKSNMHMLKFDGITLIERMLKQLDLYRFDRIVLVGGDKKEGIEQYSLSMSMNTPVSFVYSNESKNSNLYLLYKARDYLCDMDSLILNSNLIFDESLLSRLISSNGEVVAVIDKYKNWMTGSTVMLNKKNEIIGFDKENSTNHLTLKNSFKTTGLYKFSAQYFKDCYLRDC